MVTRPRQKRHGEKVKIVHPEVGESWVFPSTVKTWEANGWQLAECCEDAVEDAVEDDQDEEPEPDLALEEEPLEDLYSFDDDEEE